jgi:hypothetical protein
MDLKALLLSKRTEILEAWRTSIFHTYPKDSVRFLRGDRNEFANPVGSAITRQTEELLDGLVSGAGAEELAGCMEGVVRIRAVQDFSASDAIGFVFLLKEPLREAVRAESPDLLPQLFEMESHIDRLALAAFDLYTECRKRISEIRIGEARAEKERIARVLRAVNRGGGRGKWEEGSQ